MSYQTAFDHVKTKYPNKSVTIGSSLECFLDENISKELKKELGLMILAMILDQKKRKVLKMPDEAIKIVSEKKVEIIADL